MDFQEKAKTLIRSRGHLKSALTRFKTFFETYANTVTTDSLQKRLEANVGLLEKFNKIQVDIEDLAEGTEHEAAQLEVRTEFESMYFDLIAQVESLIGRSRPAPVRSTAVPVAPSPAISDTQIGLRLPTIKLPTFDGNYNDWVKFRDTFESIIDENDSLSGIQKFHYLNSSLKGQAARVIQSFGISNANYETAWAALKKRYEDSKALVHHHANALVKLPAVNRESHQSLRALVDDAMSHLESLRALGQPVKYWGTLVILILSKKLDLSTKREWEKRLLVLKDNPTLQNLFDFIEDQCKFLERTVSNRQLKPNIMKVEYRNKDPRDKPNYVASHITSSGKVTPCLVCKESHILVQCDKFRTLDHSAKLDAIKHSQACFNCLQSGHFSKNCTRSSCRKCGKKHHTLIHIERSLTPPDNSNAQATTSQVSSESSSAQSYLINTKSIPSDYVVLATAVVNVKDAYGKTHECRALLDAGSQAHFVTEKFCKKIGVAFTSTSVTVGGLGQHLNNICSRAQLTVASQFNNFQASISCYVMHTITENMPNSPIKGASIQVPPGIKLADPQFYVPREIDLLIGAGLFWQLLCIGQHRVKSHGLVWQKTQLGWVLGGRFNHFPAVHSTPKTCHLVTNAQLQDSITKFWEIENCFDEEVPSGVIDPVDPCEKHFSATTSKAESGRFIVSIPFNEKLKQLGDSRKQAQNRLLALERKFRKIPSLKERYVEFMREYESLGHMTRVPNEPAHPSFYLPHHAVFKNESTTTKMRVVFDGSAKSSTGVSINDAQMIGPTVQDDLFSIVLRFRKHKIVLSADVAKMYRQVLIKPDERKFQRILWRAEEFDAIETFELNTVTYGTAAASFLATRVLRKIGEDSATQFPLASRVIIKDFYVDDLLTGVDTLSEAKRLKQTVSEVLMSAGFPLRKWASNDSKVVMDECEDKIQLGLDKDPKTLGLIWTVHEDKLQFSVKPHENVRVTKRSILSQVSQIFDPLGLIAPVLVKAKIMMQELWQLKLGWDESVSQELHSRWSCFREELPQLNKLEISRRVIIDKPSKIELHGFSDASEKAYGACIYVRSIDINNKVTVRLLCAKSRVAPLKVVTLPRLELCGAVLLAQLMMKVKAAIEITNFDEYYWTDSSIVLAWINAPSVRWKTYVANRVSTIQSNSNIQNWHHVSSEDNPADIISRGIKPSLIATINIWWNGPSWLHRSSEEWPRVFIPVDEQLELKQVSSTLHSVVDCSIIDRFSSYSKLVRTVAQCFRFFEKIRTKLNSKNNVLSINENDKRELDPRHLSTSELIRAEQVVLRIAQQEGFRAEIKLLQLKREIPKSSSLLSLRPFLDKVGIMRVGGRLAHAHIPYSQQHPIILPAKHRLTNLLIEYEHNRLLHAGCQQVVSSLRRKYWPLACKVNVKGILRKCVRCFRAKPVPVEQLMGNLPAFRLIPSRPFFNCGVDFAGPFLLKERGRNRVTIKAYLCVFVCFVTKAVHLELAVDLSTDAFLNCFRRFIARRGKCRNIFSDNGTNFVGARNEMNEIKAFFKDENNIRRISNFWSNEQIDWHFIPPHSPHFGGLWESTVKSVKYHLKRVIGDQRLTFEEVYTLLTQVEACLNSRPLSPLSDDPDDLTPLTPGHFLIGDAMTALPEHDLQEIKQNRLNRYQLVQQMLQHYWSRWHKEYLHNLQQRHKWKHMGPQKVAIGTLVVVKEDNLPPLRWRLGRILEIHPGTDSVPRVVTIKTSDGIIRRPTVKICILPLEGDPKEDTDSSSDIVN